jgi:hypothetical protein
VWRWIVLWVVAGCAKQYGSFVEIDGAIDFDRVELHFGIFDGPAMLATPGHPQGLAGTLYARDAAPTDEPPAGMSTRSHTVYLAGAAANAGLSYVVAVAFAHDVPVGIGELFDLEVPDDRTLIYHLTLEPYDATAVERWGRDRADCVAWTRARDGDPAPSTIAVVRADDRDCDGFTRADDCDDAAFCADEGCGALGVCGDGDTCAIGRCTNHLTGPATCEPVTCVIPGLCAPDCIAYTGPEDLPGRDFCGIGLSLQHGELLIPTEGGKVCNQAGSVDYFATFALPNGLPCNAPLVDYVDPRTPGFTYDIQPALAGTDCRLYVFPNAAGAVFAGDHHIMISFQPADPTLPRWSLVIGVAALAMGSCTTPAQFTPSGEVSDCH